MPSLRTCGNNFEEFRVGEQQQVAASRQSMTEEIKEMFGKMLEEFSEVRRQHQEMMSWRTEVNRRPTEPAAHRDNNEDESMHDQDDEDLGWEDRLTGTQTQASQPGAASLVSLFASPPPSGPDGNAGKGSGAIQGSATDTHTRSTRSCARRRKSWSWQCI